MRIVGVEPELSATMTAALSGLPAPARGGQTFADGLDGGIEPGSVTVEICRRRGIEMLTVSELAMQAAVRYLAFEVGLVAEGAGAAAVAALRSGPLAIAGGITVVLVTGRNIAPLLLSSILSG